MATLADIVVQETSDSPVGNSARALKMLSEEVAESAESETGGTDQSAKSGSDPLEAELSGEAIPEKFRGKKVRDVLESYTNLESANGRMANELGTQRSLTDRLLDLKRNEDLSRNTPPPQRKRVEITAAEILDKPAETLDRVLTQREEAITAEVNRRLAGVQAGIAEQAFRGRHPDFQTVVNDPSFGEWVRSKPIRMRAAAAANSGDWQIATELLDEFKADKGKPSGSGASGGKSAADLEAARTASLTTSTGGGSDGAARKGKRYKRSDLMRLRIENPEAYYDDEFQAKILQAYHEKRVDD